MDSTESKLARVAGEPLEVGDKVVLDPDTGRAYKAKLGQTCQAEVVEAAPKAGTWVFLKMMKHK